MTLPAVAIVGRPNVGKSTLFNRIVRGRQAIVENEPGVTRDRLYRETEWLDRRFILVDTGGMESRPQDSIRAEVQEQTARAVREAEVVLLVVDAREGVTPGDEAAAEIIRRAGKRVVLVANKVDHPSHRDNLAEFYRLGLGDPVGVSAQHGQNIGDLLDRVLELLPEPEPVAERTDVPRVAVVGRPNVGKSSLVNYLLGDPRVVVSEEAGTTRDAVDVTCILEGREMVFIDTAGLRRRARIAQGVEKWGTLRSIRAIRRATVVLLLLDVDSGIALQDQRIAGFIQREGKPLIIGLNKWDLLSPEDREELLEEIDEKLDFVDYAPRLPISAVTGLNLRDLPGLIARVEEESQKRISTGELNRALEEALLDSPPPRRRGRQLRILYVSQVGTVPPTFVFFVNDPQLVHFSYRRYLENRWRRRYGFEGSPLVFHFRSRKGPESG